MNPTVVKIVLALVALVVAGAGTWAVRGWQADAEQLAVVRAEAKQNADNADALAAGLQQIAIVRERERQQAALDRAAFQRRLKDETSREPLVECQSDRAVASAAVAGADVRFQPGFVRLWNEALAIRLPEALRAGRTESPDPGADLPTVEDILSNLAANAESCNELRARALTCKDWIERIEALP